MTCRRSSRSSHNRSFTLFGDYGALHTISPAVGTPAERGCGLGRRRDRLGWQYFNADLQVAKAIEGPIKIGASSSSLRRKY